jgi:hypothetical protein
MYIKGDRIVVKIKDGRKNFYYTGTVIGNTSKSLKLQYDMMNEGKPVVEEVAQNDPSILGKIKTAKKYDGDIPLDVVNVLLVKDEPVAPVAPVKPSQPVKPVVKLEPEEEEEFESDETPTGPELYALELESLAIRIRKMGQGGTQGARFKPATIKADLKLIVEQINKELK